MGMECVGHTGSRTVWGYGYWTNSHPRRSLYPLCPPKTVKTSGFSYVQILSEPWGTQKCTMPVPLLRIYWLSIGIVTSFTELCKTSIPSTNSRKQKTFQLIITNVSQCLKTTWAHKIHSNLSFLSPSSHLPLSQFLASSDGGGLHQKSII